MRNSKIKRFEIKGLFGTKRSFSVPFKSDIKILIGENGLGKTTILNLMYHTLNQSFHKLLDYKFESIKVEFTNNKKVVIERKDLSSHLEELDYYDDPNMRMVGNIMSQTDLNPHDIIEAYKNKRISKYEIHEVMTDMLPDKYMRRYSPSHFLRMLERYVEREQKTSFSKTRNTIAKYLKDTTILYFPTYRRIEEDLRNLGLDENVKINKNDQRLIQFGMRDVRERFESLKDELESLSSQGLSKISSEILSQLIKGVPSYSKSSINKLSVDDIEIILARVGKALSDEDKSSILKITREKDFADADPMLIYFLQKLIDVYDQQRQIDEDIKKFVSICNKYLERSRKQIIYNESDVEFYIQIDEELFQLSQLLSKLSSGEKQIISLFSKIYLSKDDNYYVLFDEPELSLSIFWQRMLLPDILKSNKCNFLLSVTHSPFIFENELDEFAIGLNEYFI